MTATEVCGWECNLVSSGQTLAPDERHWDILNGTMAISTTTVRTGARSLRSNVSATTGFMGKNIARTIVAGRVYFYIATMPGGTSHFVAAINASGSGLIRCTSTGQLTLQAGAGSVVNLDSPVSTGQWYLLDWLYDCSTGTASLKAKLNGGTEAQSTNAQASANCTTVRFGWQSAVTADIFFDDLLMGDAAGDYPFGAGLVEGVLPNADGTHSFTAGDFGYETGGGDVATSATDVWTHLDSGDLNQSAELIRQKVVRSTGYVEVNFAALTLETTVPQAVALLAAWHASTTGADTVGLKWNDNGTVVAATDPAGDGLSDVSNVAVGQSENVRATRPSGGGAWDNTQIGSVLRARMGYSTDVLGIPYCDAIMLEVAMPASVAAATSLPLISPARNLYTRR